MGFLSPFILWALPAALIPWLANLWIRRQGRKIEFSSLYLIRKIQSQTLSSSNLKNSLLTFLRCAIIFLLVLSYAGPIKYGSATKETRIDLAVLVDESYSMGYLEGGKTRFSWLMNSLSDLLKQMKPQDRVLLLPFSDHIGAPMKNLAWETPNATLKNLPSLRVGYGGTDFSLPLKALRALWPDSDVEKHVVLVLSDGAKHGFRAPVEKLNRTFGIDWGPRAHNDYIHSVKISEPFDAKRPALTVFTHNRKPTSLAVSTFSGQKVERPIQGGDGIRENTLLLPKINSDALIAGKASLREDSLPVDDSFFFSFAPPHPGSILCLYSAPSFLEPPHGGYFLKKILDNSARGLLPYQITFREAGPDAMWNLSSYQAVILSHPGFLSQREAQELKEFVGQGKGLWVIPGETSPSRDFDSLKSILPSGVGPVVRGEASGLKSPASKSAKDWQGLDLSQIQITRYHLLENKKNGDMFLKSPQGYPLLICAHNSRVCVSAFSLGIEDSNLAVHPALIAFLRLVFEKIMGPVQKPKSYQLTVGDPIVKKWDKNSAAPENVLLKTPNGKKINLHVQNRSVFFPATTLPGLYELDAVNHERFFYAVNANRNLNESDLTPKKDPPWRSLDAHSWVGEFMKNLKGQNERSAILFLVLAFFCAEMFLSSKGKKIFPFLFLFLLALPPRVKALDSDAFIWTQLKMGPNWDPYPNAYRYILSFVSQLTSVPVSPERRAITLEDPELFLSPMVILAGEESPENLTPQEIRILSDYIRAGGILWIENDSGVAGGGFENWTQKTLKAAFPQLSLRPVELGNILFKTFFLMKEASGLRIENPGLETLDYNGRIAVIYDRDDLLGVWEEDALGRPLYPVIPGGGLQRELGKRLTLNIILYALTGDYKADAVHQPYLIEKMRSGIP